MLSKRLLLSRSSLMAGKVFISKLQICHCYVYFATSSVGILLLAGKFWDEDKDEIKIR